MSAVNFVVATEVTDQGRSSTCFAHAASNALISVCATQYGGSMPDQGELLATIIQNYGCEGGHADEVVRDLGRPYHAQVRQIHSDSEISAAIIGNPLPRVVLMSFRLPKPDKYWDFFAHLAKKHEPLSKDNIGLEVRKFNGSDTDGHAVCIVAETDNAWIVRNSWSTGWGEKGYFLLAKNDPSLHQTLQCRFFDVFWTLDGLPRLEKQKFASASICDIAIFHWRVISNHNNFLSGVRGVKLARVPQPTSQDTDRPFRIHWVHKKNKVLDAFCMYQNPHNGAYATVHDFLRDDFLNQLFYYNPETQTIEWACDRSYVLDVWCGRKENGTEVRLHKKATGNPDNQKFEFHNDGYIVWKTHPNYCLDLVGGNSDNGKSRIQIYKKVANNSNQKWKREIFR